MGSLIILLVLVSLVLNQFHGVVGGHTQDPTYGFISLPLNGSHFDIQRPYDLPESSRYSYTDGVHKFWVLSTNKPHSPTSQTKPRTEIRIAGYNYSSGIWQFEGYTYVPTGTTGVSIVQIHGTHVVSTTLMLHVYDGALMFYRSQVLADDIYGRWFKVNVIHDVGAGKLKVFINGDLKLVEKDHGGDTYYFKFGAYEQKNSSFFMESRWKGIKLLKKLSY